MASSTTIVKQEKIDNGYEDESSPGYATYARYGTPMTSSPTGVDSTTTPTPDMMPPLKRMRYDSEQAQSIQNGRLRSALEHHHQQQQQQKQRSELGDGLGMPSNYEHYEAAHAHSVLDGLAALRGNKKNTDVVLVVDGKEITCHKAVLCSASKYFAQLFLPTDRDDFCHLQQQRVQVTETSYDVMSQLVDFTYTSRIRITGSNIGHLLSAAMFFQFSSVCEACVSVLKQRLTPQTCIAIKRFANSQGCRELAECAHQFACKRFDDVSASDVFLSMSLKELACLLSSSNLAVKDEESVYESAMTWIRHDVTGRKGHVGQVLRHVRLPLVKPQFLLDVVQTDPLISGNKDCESCLDEARRFQLLADQRPLMQSCRTQPRSTYSSQRSEVLVVVGGLNKDKVPVHDCVYYNYPSPSGMQIAPLQLNQTAYSVATINNNIFVTGGAFHSPYKDVWMYIPSLDTWQQVAPMLEARYLHASTGLDRHLYVVGGHDGSTRLKSVEKYQPDSNTWKTVEPMLKDLSSPCVVACDGMLYVIGGAKGSLPDDIVCDVQLYSPKTNVWKTAAPLPQPERGALAANLNGTIYVMGQQCSVSAYNRKSNVWVTMRPSQGGHLHGAATVHKGKLYIAGGLHGNSFINGTVEVYDQLNNSWQVISTLHAPVYAQGFVSIFKDIASSALTSS